ncbi:secreted protein, partial [gut metagenome]
MKKIFTGTILAVIAVLCIAGYALFSFLTPEKGLDNLAPSDRLSLKKNIVVLGVDERAEEYDVGRS